MKSRPILFRGRLVRAILDGRKTQTRRVIEPQPSDYCGSLRYDAHERDWFGWDERNERIHGIWKCPYGQSGDRLWVRENAILTDEPDGFWRVKYQADEAWRDVGPFESEPTFQRWKKRRKNWRPSIHLPRWASRITLEITEIRAERLQGISEKDAEAEGVQTASWTARQGFCNGWQSIYGRDSWESNPWVWVVKFNRITK